jgi:molecular chaperone GrpE
MWKGLKKMGKKSTKDKHEEPQSPISADPANLSEEAVSPLEEPVVGEKPADIIEKLKAELAEAKAKLLYLQADYQNYRKRTVKDLADARMFGVEMTLEPFLRVYDFLAMAKTSAEKSDNLEAIRQGIALIISEYAKALDDLNVRKIDGAGKAFDPKIQEAVSHEPSETVPEGVVIRDWASAYAIGERVLRSGKVVVSAGKPKAAAEPEANQEEAKQ